jgi:hypothetical protein
MPILYERDDAKRRVVETSVGAVTLKDIFIALERQIADDAWSYSVLADARAMTKGPTAAELHQLLMRIGALTLERGPRGRTAVVITDRTLAQMGEKFARLSELTAYDVKVFDSIDAADHWLELSPEAHAGPVESPLSKA